MIKFFIFFAGILAIFLAVVFGFSVFLSPDDLKKCGENSVEKIDEESRENSENNSAQNCKIADVIVAISGGNTKARAEKAVELYEQNFAPKIIFAGAAADPNSPSNASEMREIAIQENVPARDILIEENSKNTLENAKNVAEILRKNNFKNVILVSENYHLRRAKILFEAALKDEKNDGEKFEIRTTSARENSFWWISPRGWFLEFSEIGGILKFYFDGGKI